MVPSKSTTEEQKEKNQSYYGPVEVQMWHGKRAVHEQILTNLTELKQIYKSDKSTKQETNKVTQKKIISSYCS